MEHVRLDGAKGTVHVRWPGPKTDTTGIGCMRSWACLCCGSGRRPDGPYHRARAQLHLLGDLFGDPLPAEMPFFSNKEGRTIAEAQLVAALEATAKAMGQEIVNENGTKHFGVHSFRVVGAGRLGSLGVEVARIIVWARELQDKIGEPRKRSATPGRAVQKVISLAVEALRAEFSPTPAGQIIAKASGRKRKVHMALTDGMDVNPTTWRTRCGARFADWRFTRHTGTEGFKSEMLCRTCFPTPQPGAGGSSSNSSSGSDSSGCENDIVMNAVDSDC